MLSNVLAWHIQISAHASFVNCGGAALAHGLELANGIRSRSYVIDEAARSGH